ERGETMTPFRGWLAVLLLAPALWADDGARKAPPVAKPQAPERVWTPGLKRGVAEALRSGKPIIVRAGAEWCEWCNKLAGEVRDEKVQNELDRWTAIVIDADKDAAGVRRLGVGPIP